MHAVAHRNSVLVFCVVLLDDVLRRRLGLALSGKIGSDHCCDENWDECIATHTCSSTRK